MDFYKKILTLNNVHIINADIEFNKLVKKSFKLLVLIQLQV